MYRTRFQVRGTGPFPIDMLRWDTCHPTTEDDSARIANSHRILFPSVELIEYTIYLIQFHRYKQNSISEARWESFGWRVVGEITTNKV